jgi:hypothetical protein
MAMGNYRLLRQKWYFLVWEFIFMG